MEYIPPVLHIATQFLEAHSGGLIADWRSALERRNSNRRDNLCHSVQMPCMRIGRSKNGGGYMGHTATVGLLKAKGL